MVVSGSEETYAIEHTRLYRPFDRKGVSLQAQETERFELIKEAQKIYEQSGRVPLFVSVNFREVFGLETDPEIALTKRKRQRLAKTIANLVEKISLGKDEMALIQPQPRAWQTWPKEVENIFVCRHRWLAKSQWASDVSAVVPQLSSELIQNCIDKKEVQLQTYKERYPQRWLVLVELGSSLSSYFNFENSKVALKYIYRTSFDRIILFRYLHQEVFVLKIKAKT